MRTRTVAMALALGLAAVSCGEDAVEPDDTGTIAAERPASTAQLTVVEPAQGATIEGTEVRVVLELEGAVITEEVTTDLRPDEGHIHLRIDGETVTLLGGLDEVVEDVGPGPHLLEVEFVAADHGPFNPRVITTVSFTTA